LESFFVTISPPGEFEYDQHVISLFDLDSLRQQLGCNTPEGGSILRLIAITQRKQCG
jgi:hypothetical protein